MMYPSSKYYQWIPTNLVFIVYISSYLIIQILQFDWPRPFKTRNVPVTVPRYFGRNVYYLRSSCYKTTQPHCRSSSFRRLLPSAHSPLSIISLFVRRSAKWTFACSSVTTVSHQLRVIQADVMNTIYVRHHTARRLVNTFVTDITHLDQLVYFNLGNNVLSLDSLQ